MAHTSEEDLTNRLNRLGPNGRIRSIVRKILRRQCYAESRNTEDQVPPHARSIRPSCHRVRVADHGFGKAIAMLVTAVANERPQDMRYGHTVLISHSS